MLIYLPGDHRAQRFENPLSGCLEASGSQPVLSNPLGWVSDVLRIRGLRYGS